MIHCHREVDCQKLRSVLKQFWYYSLCKLNWSAPVGLIQRVMVIYEGQGLMSVAHNPAYDPDRPVGYWQLLKQNPRFRTLWTAQLISTAGDWFNSVAVLGLVLQ